MANRKTVTKHALQRCKSRLGVKEKNEAFELAEIVLKEGVRVRDIGEGELKDYLFNRYRSNTQRKNTYIYENNVYIFNKNKILITTYPLKYKGGEQNGK